MAKMRMTLVAFLLATLFLILYPAVLAEDSWFSKAQMPTRRNGLGVAVIDKTIYAIGGDGPIDVNEAYDSNLNTWIKKSSIPNPKQRFAIATYQGKIYCLGGISLAYEGENKVYDPVTDSWETKASMPTGRYNFQANVVNGKIYCMGGFKVWSMGGRDFWEKQEGAGQLNEVYDPATDTWTTKSPMLSPAGYVSAVVDNKIYVIGPELTQIYNPETDEWSTASPPPAGIPVDPIEFGYFTPAAAAATTGTMAPKRIYVYDGASLLQVYDPLTDSWTFGTSPPTSRRNVGIAVVNDMLYFIGGSSYGPQGISVYATSEQYTPFGYGTVQPTTSPMVPQPELQVPVEVIAVASTASDAMVFAGLLVFLRKRKH